MPSINGKLVPFAAGALTALVITTSVYFIFLRSDDKSKSSALIRRQQGIQGDDDCHSLYYDILRDEQKGVGFSEFYNINSSMIAKLRTVHPDYCRLPFKLYKEIVETMPIVCVDVICQRKDGKMLLFYRRDKPAASIWWWPGGRMFRGETFFDTAVRKIKDETGQKSAAVTPQGVVTVWNTFFPDSHWDAERAPGREGTQTVNVVVVCRMDCLDQGDECDAANSKEWAVEAHKWVSAEEAVEPGAYDKYVSSNAKLATSMGLLL